MLSLSVGNIHADQRMYKCELGVFGGCGYYVGDATEHIFQNVREMYGADFRWRFTKRWCLNVKGEAHRIVGYMPDEDGIAHKDLGMWKNQMVNVATAAEFNFFRFGEKQYDSRVKPLSPYIEVGVGFSVHSNFRKASAYMPFGVGLKWKFAQRCNLNLLWEHKVFFTDKLENVDIYDDLHKLNGSNILNFDLTGTLSVGLSVEFGKLPRPCRRCDLEKSHDY